MLAKWITGEERRVYRYKRGVIWCPFCDRSRQDTAEPLICDGCNAVFTPVVDEPIGEVTPRSRRRTAPEVEINTDVSESVTDENEAAEE